MSITNDLQVEIYRRMRRIRGFDEAAIDLVAKGQIPGAVHCSIGQEAEIVGACVALRSDDYEVGNHRSHGHPIGMGASLNELMAELMGKVTGVNHGKGGSMHLADFKVGSLGESSIVGSGIPVAVGAALAAKMSGTDRISLCFFGDGASNEGAFHEALNLAAIWKLPVIFLCENNGYAATTAATYAVSVKDIADRARSYDIPGVVVDGQDPIAVFEAVAEAVKRARAGHGPTLIEAKTYRYREHAEGPMWDALSGYRSSQEVAEQKERDPVLKFREYLLESELLTADELDQIDAEVEGEVQEAVKFARDSAYPAEEEAYQGVFREPIAMV